MTAKLSQTRLKLLLILMLATIIAIVVSIPIFYLRNINYCYLLIAYLLVFLLLFPFIYYEKIAYAKASNIVVLLEATLILTLPVVNGELFFVIGWVVLFPVIPLSLKGHDKGLRISITFFVVFIGMYFLGYLHESYSWLNIFMVTLMHLVLTIVLFMILKNLDQREEKIIELNATLEKKIKTAVKEIREQENLILHQSRLAQMGEMISMIAHQWRQPLTSISTVAASLKIKIGLDQYDAQNFDKRLDDISHYTEHLSSTIEDFRNYFKPDKKKNSFQMHKSLEHVLSLSETLLEGNNITVKPTIKSDSTIKNFENEVVQVIISVIKNGVDILLEMQIADPTIYIELYEVDNSVVVSIEDNAGGVPDTIKDKIFEPYFSTKSKNGTGLGLYMAKSIIEDHCGGSLDFYNGQYGACFTISLPLKQS